MIFIDFSLIFINCSLIFTPAILPDPLYPPSLPSPPTSWILSALPPYILSHLPPGSPLPSLPTYRPSLSPYPPTYLRTCLPPGYSQSSLPASFPTYLLDPLYPPSLPPQLPTSLPTYLSTYLLTSRILCIDSLIFIDILWLFRNMCA